MQPEQQQRINPNMGNSSKQQIDVVEKHCMNKPRTLSHCQQHCPRCLKTLPGPVTGPVQIGYLQLHQNARVLCYQQAGAVCH